MSENHLDLLDLYPAYRRGELPPSQAHRVVEALRSDPDFAREIEREEQVLSALESLPAVTVPRGLVGRAVRRAVGESNATGWFSFEILLIAIGIGIACAAVAQLLASRLTVPAISEVLIEVANYIAVNATTVYTGAVLVLAIVLALGTWVAVRALR